MEYMVLLSSVVVVLLGLGVVAFLVLKKKLIQENLNVEEEQERIVGASRLLDSLPRDRRSRTLDLQVQVVLERQQDRILERDVALLAQVALGSGRSLGRCER